MKRTLVLSNFHGNLFLSHCAIDHNVVMVSSRGILNGIPKPEVFTVGSEPPQGGPNSFKGGSLTVNEKGPSFVWGKACSLRLWKPYTRKKLKNIRWLKIILLRQWISTVNSMATCPAVVGLIEMRTDEENNRPTLPSAGSTAILLIPCNSPSNPEFWLLTTLDCLRKAMCLTKAVLYMFLQHPNNWWKEPQVF